MRKVLLFYISLLFAVTIVIGAPIEAQSTAGQLRGEVSDGETQAPLTGVNVIVENSDMGSATDSLGRFVIRQIPPGSYSVRLSYIGYESLIKSDVIIRPDRTTWLRIELTVSSLSTQAIQVTGDYFAPVPTQPTSTVSFSNEEIRRTPGAAGDISRMMMMLPGVAKINDQVNSLIVRGGSPAENAFYVDNIEIPNINHFPVQGTSTGSIGLLNVDFIRDVRFSTGGFSAEYGDKLSSVMDIKFREGDREDYDGQFDLNFSGIGGVAEGPIPGENSSWMIAARRSYLDFLTKLLDFGVTPMYSDIQGKVVFHPNHRHTISLLDIYGMDSNSISEDQAKDLDVSVYGTDDHAENTMGMNWKVLWSASGYSQTSISYSANLFQRDFKEYGTESPVIYLDSGQHTTALRNINHFRLNPVNSIEFGIEAKYFNYRYNNIYGAYTDALGNPSPAIRVKQQIEGSLPAIYINYILHPTVALEMTAGLRGNYFTVTNNHGIEPRFAVTFHLTNRTALYGATGLYLQHPPLNLLSQIHDTQSLKTLKAVHYILGIDHLLTEDTRMSLELYQKEYSNFPMDPEQPELFIIDEPIYRDGFYYGHQSLTSAGTALSYGVEAMIQKKLAVNFYGVISASWFRSEYQDLKGTWRPRSAENRYLLNIEGGYKPNNRWEFSERWIFAGGRPYTPFDINASTQANRGILDSTRVNTVRYPVYHSLNIRVDRRFLFANTNIVLYISLWNAYNQQNIASYFWNKDENKPDKQYQWSLLPIFGLEYEF